MNDLDPRACYRALASRDARFDGCFFVGVLTTGVYCRPVCPARTANAKNVRFFLSAAAAEREGFRPCRRCHPEAAPGSPAWIGAPFLLSRALRLIDAGALDRDGVDGVASRLGLSPRHLARLFSEHLGAPPIAVAQTRRAHFAKRLIDQTAMPMSQVAYCSGFSSIRRFNAQIRATFGAAPRALRRSTAVPARPGRDPVVTLLLPFRPPLAWTHLIRFLGVRAIPGVEAVGRGTYRRTIAIQGRAGWFEVGEADRPHCLKVRLNVPAECIRPEWVDRIRNMFDLGANPGTIASQLGKDRTLAPFLHRLPGVRVPGAWDGFELAVRAVLGQQISVAAATTLAGRLVERFGTPLRQPSPPLTHLFPEPKDLVRADVERIGLPAARARTLRDLARAVADGALKLDGSQSVAESIESLRRIRGVGPWTAGYIAMRALRDPDAFPTGDLGIRRRLADGRALRSPADVERRAESWRPWRSYAAMYLWNG